MIGIMLKVLLILVILIYKSISNTCNTYLQKYCEYLRYLFVKVLQILQYLFVKVLQILAILYIKALQVPSICIYKSIAYCIFKKVYKYLCNVTVTNIFPTSNKNVSALI